MRSAEGKQRANEGVVFRTEFLSGSGMKMARRDEVMLRYLQVLLLNG